MAVYSVHEPPGAPQDRIDRAEAMVFVRDGFSWGAALVPPLWLAAQGAWLAAAGYIGVAGLMIGLLQALGVHPEWIACAVIALNVFVGFEAASLQRWALEFGGWTEAGSVSGRTREDCERRFFDIWLAGEPVLRPKGDTASGEPVTHERTARRWRPLRMWRDAGA